MALQLSLLKSISNYSVLTLIDNTGDYDASNNVGGWGTPNIELSEVNYAHLIINTPSNSIKDIDDFKF